MKLLVIFNPQARSGGARNALAGLKAEFEANGVSADFMPTQKRGDATRLVAQARVADYGAVIAAGGDGTVFETVNGLFSHPREHLPPMGLIPLGTGNAFAREFDLFPENWKEAVSRICRFQTREVDVGEISGGEDSFYFLNIAGIGFATGAGLKARKLKFIGKSAYTLGTLWETIGLKSYPLSIELDGRTIEQDNVLLEVSNSRYTGTSFLIAPAARLDDGMLDVTLLRGLSRFRLLKLFPSVFKGQHVAFEEVETYQAKIIRIKSPEEKLLTVDGEFQGKTPVTITCHHQALELIV